MITTDDARVEVWTCTDQELALMINRLPWRRVFSAEERERVQRIIPADRRRRAIGSFLLRRVVLAMRTGQRPARLSFVTGEFGRPELRDNPWRLRFNMSHTEGLLACVVVTGRDCGIDVEPVLANPDTLIFGPRRMAPAERAALAALPAPVRAAEFVDRWVLKEAYTKALGLGMQHGFDTFELGPDELGRIVLRDPSDNQSQWDFLLAAPPHSPQHRLAVAVRRQAGDPVPLPVRFWRVSQAHAFLGVPDQWAGAISGQPFRRNVQIGVAA